MEERSKLQKAVLISMAAMVVLFGILTLISHVRKGVEFEGGLLRRTETEESVIYNGKVRGEQVEITVRAAGSGNLTEVDFRIGNRIQDDCTLETGLPPIQAEQLGPVEHIRITKNDILLFEGGYDPEYGMGWYDLDGNWDPFAMSVSYSSTAGDDYWEHYETDRGTILSFARGPQLVSRGSWELYFAMLLLSALLALDAAGRLLTCTCLSEGSVNSANVPMRKLMRAALSANASGVVLAHNHPAGIALPSHEDVELTRRLQQALDVVDILLLDHLVIADDDFVSLRDSGYLR